MFLKPGRVLGVALAMLACSACTELLAPRGEPAPAPVKPAPATKQAPAPAPAPTTPPPATSKAAQTSGFDAYRALNGVEQLLLTLDPIIKSRDATEADADAMRSWITDAGLRSLYHSTRARTSIYALGALFGAKVFVSGPHGEHPDYDGKDFGHYNPEFVKRVRIVADLLSTDPQRVERTRAAFEARLRRQALTYRLVYAAMHEDPTWFSRFRDKAVAAFGTDDATFVGYDDLRPLVDGFNKAGYDEYETDTACYFWVRRDVDGTALAWIHALDSLLAAYGVTVPERAPALPRGAALQEPVVSRPFELARALDGYELIVTTLEPAGETEADRALFERMKTYLPERGVRSLYFAARKHATIAMVEQLFGTPVFRAGPHGEHPNFESRDDFGRYNPEFLRRLQLAAEGLRADAARVERTRAGFNGRISRLSHTYRRAYEVAHADPAWFATIRSEYQRALSTPGENPRFVEFDKADKLATKLEKEEGIDWYEANAALYFWVRRDLDGSDDALLETLDTVLEAYGVTKEAQRRARLKEIGGAPAE